VSGGDLSGLAVWVTGAGKGLGRALAVGLAGAGCDVALTARTEASLDSVRAEVESLGVRCLTLPADVRDRGALDGAEAGVAQRWGRLDAAVACAGVSPSYTRPERITEQDWDAIIGTNLTGTFHTAVAAGRVMLEQGSGSVIAVSSIHGRHASGRLAAYSASKGGVDALVRALALDWSPRGVRVNAVAPGYFETDLTEELRSSDQHSSALLAKVPMARFGEPAELVGAVRFLVGPESSFVTGSVIDVDGGWGAG
jgi:NAD(P)-dependent dehydrogenase (short-subunit alcohol dehydrogenase family)